MDKKNILSSQNSEIIYDFEVQNNIYSITAFFKDQKQFVIYYYLAPEQSKNFNHTLFKQDVLQKAHRINDLTLHTYQDELGNNLKIDVQELTLEKLQHIFEKPDHYVVGFNSNYYDLPVASYLLQKAEKVNLDHSLPRPDEVRLLNNILINGQHEIQTSPGLKKLCGILNIEPNQRQSFFNIAKLYDTTTNLINKVYNEREKMSLRKQLDRLIKDGQSRMLGNCPDLYYKYASLNNEKGHIGWQLDMKLLNEKDKDSSTMYTSLKRISAQLGYQIEEPNEVDLSSNADLNYEQMVNLLAYNMSDVIVTTLIFQTDDYQNVLHNRENLIKRFNKTNFLDRLTVNSTSAKFVENVIAPFRKLTDQESIVFFYPVHDHAFDKIQAKISQDYDNKLVAEFTKQERLLFEEFNNEQNSIYQKSDLSTKYQFATDTRYQKAFEKKLKDFFYQKIQDRTLHYSYIPDKNDRHKVYEREFDVFRDKYLDYLNPQVADLDKLDQKWTDYLQKISEFAPKLSRWGKPNDPLITRFRVKYGEIQEDLLEKMANTFDKFPKEAYQMYSVFRNAKSTFDNRGTLIKTARDNAIEKYVKEYSLGTDHLGKAIPPKHVYFKYRKDKSVKSIVVIIQVPKQPMCLVFSIGGVHGEVIKQEYYEKHSQAVDQYNEALHKIQAVYPDPNKFVEAILQDKIDSRLSWLNIDDSWKTKKESKSLTREIKRCLKPLSIFITISKLNLQKGELTVKYKRPHKEINPKDYVIPIDMSNPVHVDVDSLYPSLMINLHLFSTFTTKYHPTDDEYFNKTHCRGHWDDLYALLRAERVHLKKTALSVPKTKWGDLQKHQWQIQLIDKLILNSASGIADGKRETNVRLNNRAASMRIMGQLALTYLVYSVEKKGVYSISTNTDGVYLTSRDPNFSEKEIHDEIEGWKYYFHLGATPEIMYRFISKDANNRFEQSDFVDSDELTDNDAPAGGTIGNAFGASSNKKMTQPFVIDSGIVHYFKTHQNICTTYDVDEESIKRYLLKQQRVIINATKYDDKVRKAMLSFCWPIQPQKGQIYMIKNGLWYEKIQHVNRIVLVKQGYGQKLVGLKIEESKNSKGKIVPYDENLTKVCLQKGLISSTSTKVAKEAKISNFEKNWFVQRVNKDLKAYFGNVASELIWRNLDIDAYAKLTVNKILGSDGKTIWVEPRFAELPVNKLQSQLNKVINFTNLSNAINKKGL